MTTPTDDSLAYIHRTIDMLIAGDHPAPRRAIHLVIVHAQLIQAEWNADRYPKSDDGS